MGNQKLEFFMLKSHFPFPKWNFDTKLEGNGPVEPAASRAIKDKHVVH